MLMAPKPNSLWLLRKFADTWSGETANVTGILNHWFREGVTVIRTSYL